MFKKFFDWSNVNDFFIGTSIILIFIMQGAVLISNVDARSIGIFNIIFYFIISALVLMNLFASFSTVKSLAKTLCAEFIIIAISIISIIFYMI